MVTTMAANSPPPGGLVVYGPRHLVALAEGAPHALSDELLSHARRWRTQFLDPLFSASSPERVDALVASLQEPFLRYLIGELSPVLVRALQAEGLSLHEVSQRTADRLDEELAHPPSWLDPLNCDDIEWSASVLFSGLASLGASLTLPSPDEFQASFEDDPNARVWGSFNLLLYAALEAVMNQRPPPSSEAFDRICELLFDSASWLARELESQGIDWRKARDAAGGSRAERILRYGSGVLADLPAKDRLALNQARLPKHLFDS